MITSRSNSDVILSPASYFDSPTTMGIEFKFCDSKKASSPYCSHELGLSSYICTNSMEKAHRASELMETGTVAVNTPLVALAEAPFGGIKQAGYGREGGSMAIKDYLNVKYTHLGLKG